MKTYTAAVIGVGSIGGIKPSEYDSLGSDNILTHCHAIQAHPNTNLIAVVDTNKEKAKEAAKKWNTHWYASIPELYYDQGLRPDIVVVATPTETHYQVLMQTLHHFPKLVVSEKPFTDNIQQARDIIEAYEKAGIPLMVDYIRRFDPTVRKVKDIIETRSMGKAQSCRVIYNRGLRREGSHAIDLCNYLFGICTVEHLFGLPITDYSEDDRTFAAHLTYSGCPHVFLTPADGRQFSIFEVDILLESGRIIFYEHGLKCAIFKTMPEPVYGDYETLCYSPTTRETGLNRALWNLVDNAVAHLDEGEALLCSARDALKVHEVIERLI